MDQAAAASVAAGAPGATAPLAVRSPTPAREAAVDAEPLPAMERMATVVTCASRVQAQLVRGALEAHGLRALVLTDDAGGIHPQLALLCDGAIRVVVPEHELDTARDLVGELDAGVHALPATGDHERIDPPRHGNGVALVALALLGVLLAYRAAVTVWPGLG